MVDHNLGVQLCKLHAKTSMGDLCKSEDPVSFTREGVGYFSRSTTFRVAGKPQKTMIFKQSRIPIEDSTDTWTIFKHMYELKPPVADPTCVPMFL